VTVADALPDVADNLIQLTLAEAVHATFDVTAIETAPPCAPTLVDVGDTLRAEGADWLTAILLVEEPALSVRTALRSEVEVFSLMVTVTLVVSFLTPPEGRTVIQSAVVEIFQSAVDVTLTVCVVAG
jgi:hypothetical protein